MEHHFPEIGRYLSILDRLMKRYYDAGLSDFAIGWGQQFYVEYLYEHPGASAQEMVDCIRVDKATLTKVIQKLASIGYVRVVRSETDRRIKRLYLTEEALPAARRIQEIHRSFAADLCADLSPETLLQTTQMLEQMMENLHRAVEHRRENPHETT